MLEGSPEQGFSRKHLETVLMLLSLTQRMATRLFVTRVTLHFFSKGRLTLCFWGPSSGNEMRNLE